MESIHIFHTNDLHSHLKRWPRIHDFLITQRAFYEAKGEDFFLFDIGDFVDRWHPLSEATRGKGNIDLLNESIYNAVTIGNNEGITFPYEDLDQMYDHAKFDVLAANLYQKANQHPKWLKPYTIYHTQKGTKIGVIGVTVSYSLLYKLLGWYITDPINELKKWLPQLKAESDVIILLSHLGIHQDEQIAAECPDVDVILGAHTHHTLPDGKVIGGTLLAGAGKFGKFVGHVSLILDDQKRIISKTAGLTNVMELPPATDEKIKSNELFRKGKKLLNKKIISLSHPLEADPFIETELARLLCSALREWCGTDCAFINSGLLLGGLSGDVSKFDLLTICPHPINPCKIDVTGTELEKIIIETKHDYWAQRPVRGLGFRGTVMGVTVYDGISFNEDEEIFINGVKINPNDTYSLALPDMFTFGHFFTDVISQKERIYYLPEFLRDLLKWKLQKQS
nr:bifunctional UDP-sugar hydrolase/5'-nucleotidase [Neobacillus sp. Marseille-Q6967]